MKSDIYTKTITVKKDHIDELNHVNNVVFLQWVQDIAGEHWLSKSNDVINNKYFWLVLNHFLEYKAQAFVNDSLIVSTYVEKNEGVKSIRIVEFHKGDQLIVRAKTNWCLIDRNRNRPARVPQEIIDMFFY